MRKSQYIFFIVISLISFVACSKNVEKIPLEFNTDEYIFDAYDSLGRNAQAYLNGILFTLPKSYNRVNSDMLDASTDDAISSATGTTDVSKLATGGYSSSTMPEAENVWASSYAGIRKANIFINNIDIVPTKDVSGNGLLKKVVWKAEARFVRALFYFELVKRYGGIPLVGDNVWALGADMQLPRNSFKSCVDYIVGECDAIYNDLRTMKQAASSSDYQSPTKGAAMALKARVLLYAASPLFNGGNIDAANDKTGYTDADPQRWKLAADAAKTVMNGEYSLNPVFKNIFITCTGQDNNVNDEVIFVREDGKGKSLEINNAPVGYSPGTANGRTSPTQELVEAFPFLDGKAVTDNTSKFYSSYSDNPYSNRDPRLSATVFCNGSQWLNSIVETFDGGRSKTGKVNQETRTSYYMRKFLGNFETSTDFADTYHDNIIFRYAEVLLNFAEAQNEFAGPSNEVYQVLKDLRKRAGIEAGGDGMYGLESGMDKDKMRKAIRNERRIELAFEEHRYWDVRRWKIAEDVCNKPLHGMQIIKGTSGRMTYTPITVFTPVFNDKKRYLYPIPYDEVVKNSNMQQNPGW